MYISQRKIHFKTRLDQLQRMKFQGFWLAMSVNAKIILPLIYLYTSLVSEL